MSKHCSLLDVYNVIVRDDVGGLENAIYLLGPNIHFVRIWCDLPPMLYAARLGHTRQVSLLFKDLDTYFFRGEEPRKIPQNGKEAFHKRWEAVLYQLILSGQTNSEITKKLIFRVLLTAYKNQPRGPIIEALVRNEVITLLHKSLTLSDGAIRSDVIRNILLYSRSKVFEFCEERKWIIEDDNLDPLSVAVLRRNKEEVQRLLDEQLVTDGGEFDWELYLNAVVHLNDEEIFELVMNKLLQTSRIEETEHVSGRKIKTTLLLAVETALIEKLDDILLHLLNIPDQLVSGEDRTRLYFNLLLRGIPVTKIKHLTTIADGPCPQLTFWERTVLPVEKFTQIDSKIPVEYLVEILAELESVPFTLEESGLVWKQEARVFPYERGRPDLIPHIQNYNPNYQVEDILQKIANPSEMLVRNLYLTKSRPMQANLDSIIAAFLGSPRADVHHHVEIYPNTVYAVWHLLHDCVLETGKPAILRVTSDASDLLQKRLTDLECRRKAGLTLQKTCRLAIRRTIISRFGRDKIDQVCLFGKLWDDIMSLYVEGYLPRRLVSYLVYQVGERPLQRRLSFLELAAEQPWEQSTYANAQKQLNIR